MIELYWQELCAEKIARIQRLEGELEQALQSAVNIGQRLDNCRKERELFRAKLAEVLDAYEQMGVIDPEWIERTRILVQDKGEL